MHFTTSNLLRSSVRTYRAATTLRIGAKNLRTMSSGKVHDVAVSGFKEGTNDLYDQSRPSYPAGALNLIAQSLPHPSPSNGYKILEPGSGTGIFSRLLLNPPEGYPQLSNLKLIGVEPSGGMRKAWEKGYERIKGDVEKGGRRGATVNGSFEDFALAKEVEGMDIKEGEVDGVIVAQAWHWCPDFEASLREIAKYLSPRGILYLVWNQESMRVPWQKDIRALYDEYDQGSPQQYKGWWRKMYETEAYKTYFEAPEERSVAWEVGLREEELTNRILSKSYLTETYLNGQDREIFLEKLRKIIRDENKEWVDKSNGVFRYTYDTDVIIIRRKQA